jgi:hypothetical protein
VRIRSSPYIPQRYVPLHRHRVIESDPSEHADVEDEFVIESDSDVRDGDEWWLWWRGVSLPDKRFVNEIKLRLNISRGGRANKECVRSKMGHILKIRIGWVGLALWVYHGKHQTYQFEQFVICSYKN